VESQWRRLQFVARARTIAKGRWLVIVGAAAILSIPGWAEALGLVGPAPWLLLAAMTSLGVLHHLLLPREAGDLGAGDEPPLTSAPAPGFRPRGSSQQAPPPGPVPERTSPSLLRTVSYLSLCVDTLAALYLVAATGGLRSPLLALQVGLTALFVLLFPRPLAALPALAILPVLAQLERALGLAAPGGLFEPLAVLGYGALDLAIIFLIVGASRREEIHHAGLIRLERAEGELALAEERARLSREMHDGLGAALTGLSMQAEVLLGLCESGRLREEALDLRAAADDALDELRQGLWVIRGEFGLYRAARSHCEQLGRRAKQEIRYRDDGVAAIPLPGQAQLSLFRLLQEALSNAVRHAEANVIDVELAADDAHCVVSIRDDGRGFDPRVDRVGHYGLRGMRERALRLGAALELVSAPGQGTDVRIAVPIQGAR